MSGLMDKAKDALKGNDKAEKFADKQVNTQVDNATDRAGLGDKYDKKISDGINNQTHEQVFKK
ncbi:hypothetical protein WHR41_03516 [Cladosporium halotolerans]|uniref:Antitoxin n=1 Tax=Cladosporium halotolerans TaxID=1052096 RepID=A0AB34KSV4_9PEZI